MDNNGRRFVQLSALSFSRHGPPFVSGHDHVICTSAVYDRGMVMRRRIRA